MQMLHKIQLWRQGETWSTADGNGELDHYLFRHRGYERYSLWRNRMTSVEVKAVWPSVQVWEEKESTREKPSIVEALYKATEQGNDVTYDINLCRELMVHFPQSANPLVEDHAHSGLVDKAQSQAFLGDLRGMVDQVFRFQGGNLTGLHATFAWWDRE